MQDVAVTSSFAESPPLSTIEMVRMLNITTDQTWTPPRNTWIPPRNTQIASSNTCTVPIDRPPQYFLSLSSITWIIDDLTRSFRSVRLVITVSRLVSNAATCPTNRLGNPYSISACDPNLFVLEVGGQLVARVTLIQPRFPVSRLSLPGVEISVRPTFSGAGSRT